MELLIFILLLALVFAAIWLAFHGQVLHAAFVVLLLVVIAAIFGAPDLHELRHR